MKLLRETLLLLLIAVFPAALAVSIHPELADRTRSALEPGAVRLDEALSWGDSVLWVDARGPAAHARGHIPGAIAFDEGAFSESLGALVASWTPDRQIVIYCDSTACSKARELAQHLRDAGFTDVHHLHGGWDAWNAAHP